jgi:signal transduction histidine kinase
MRDLASAQYPTREKIRAASKLLEKFKAMVRAESLLAKLPPRASPQAWPIAVPATPRQEPQPQSESGQQAQRSMNEWQARSISKAQASNREYVAQRAQDLSPQAGRVQDGIMTPLWVGDALLLARRVSVDQADYVQGVWLNWPAIRLTLLESARDLVPAARLEPSESEAPDKQPRRLASLPIKLAPGPVPFDPRAALSPIRIALSIAWVCVVIGSAAIGAMLWGAMSLSERRGAFVSAVTHELRTPLTTVSMYAEMLQEGMVPDQAKRQQYLATLRAEADRLGHLVENVLAYSRIERGRAKPRIQDVPLGQLIESARKRLADRARQAGMELAVETPTEAEQMSVRADPSAVEQILFNLVDNAGKYAAGAKDRRIHLQAERNGSYATIRVRDHGPGIAQGDRRKLFRPFSKSARDAANSAPGVGLGLALSRRLARQMRGDLRLEPAEGEGAQFVLSLPVAQLLLGVGRAEGGRV